MTLARVIHALIGRFPHMFAVVDAASNPETLRWLKTSDIQYECLFQGDKAVSLAEEAPYLVSFGDDAVAVANLVTIGHETNAIIYVQSSSSFEALRRHVRRLLIVKDDSGEQLYFRFYDPRVARAFLPTCDAEQLSWMYGDVVDSWLTCGQQKGQLLELALQPAEDGVPSRATVTAVVS